VFSGCSFIRWRRATKAISTEPSRPRRTCTPTRWSSLALTLFSAAGPSSSALLALRHRLPAIHQFRRFAAAGGLASYGGSFLDSYRQVGIYTGRILKGEKPADLPVQQSTKLELILNLKTATTLGIEVPRAVLARAPMRSLNEGPLAAIAHSRF
jgi:hypothetical protein